MSPKAIAAAHTEPTAVNGDYAYIIIKFISCQGKFCAFVTSLLRHALARRKERRKAIDKGAVTAREIRSEMGAAHRIDSTPDHTAGRMRISGIKHTTSRMVEAMVAYSGLPTAWKKMELVLIRQLKVISDRKMRIVFSPNSQ